LRGRNTGPLLGTNKMSTVVGRHFSPEPHPGFPDYLDRAFAVRALVLLVVFVLAGGHRTLEGLDED